MNVRSIDKMLGIKRGDRWRVISEKIIILKSRYYKFILLGLL